MRYWIALLITLGMQHAHADSMTEKLGTLVGAEQVAASYPLPPIGEIHLEMDKLDADVVFRKEPHDTSSFPAMLKDGNKSLPGRIAVKGSFTRNFIKKSVAITLEKGSEWHGMRKIALNAMGTDPADLRERLAWDLIAALGMAAPQVDYVRLYINDKFIGLFLKMEWITDATFARYGLGKGGEFVHPVDAGYCGDLMPANRNRLDDCWLNLSGHDGKAVFDGLRQMVDELNSSSAEEFDRVLEKYFDVDSVLNWLVVNAVTSDGDTYNKNYFMYRDPGDGRWHVVPWDYDLTFGRNADPALPFPQSILNDNFYYLHTPDLGNRNPLKEKTLANPRLLQRYRKRMAHVMGVSRDEAPEVAFGWLAPKNFIGRIQAVRSAIKGDIEADRYQPVTEAEVQRHTDALAWYGLMRYHFLKAVVLEPSPFGTARWNPGVVYPLLVEEKPITIPLSLIATVQSSTGKGWGVPLDGWLSRPLGLLRFTAGEGKIVMRVSVDAETAPLAFPPGHSASSCVQRSWYLDLLQPSGGVVADLTLDFLEENSMHHELGSVARNAPLALWRLRNQRWEKLPTQYNDFSNTLAVEGVAFERGEAARFAACVDNAH